MFDPFDDDNWRAGTMLAWHDSALSVRPPAWLPDPGQAERRLTGRRDRVLRALGLIHSHRTVETGQLHRLDPLLPARARSRLWLDMAACGLIDVGFPIDADGRARFHPATARFMAVRLPAHERIERRLDALGFTPVEIASIGPGPLRGRRQYDRHNLIAAELAVVARRDGWRTAGEAWGRFDRMTGSPDAGQGGPDLELIGEHTLVCVELTASMNESFDGKVARWRRILQHPGMERTHVAWLSAGRPGDPVAGALRARVAGEPRMHYADARVWPDRGVVFDDGFAPEPGHVGEPGDWMRYEMSRLGRLVGFDDAGSWRLPERLRGRWLG